MEKSSTSISTLSLILFIIVVTLINSVSNLIPPNLTTISSYFGFGGDSTPIGFLTFSFTLITGLVMLIFGYLADKIIRKWIVLFGTLIFSLSSLITILVPSGYIGYILFYLFTIINGSAFGALLPSIFSLMGDIISQKDRSKGFSFFSIASLLGIAFGTGLATFAGSSDWRIPYLIIGVVALISTVLFLFFKEPSRIGKDYLYILDEEVIDYSYRINVSDLKVIFKKKANIWLVINFVDTIPTGIILFLLYTYMDEYHGITQETTLFILLFILITLVIGTIIFGFIGDKFFRKGSKKARVKLALFGNIAPIPLIFIALVIPFRAPNLFPGIVIWIILFCIGMFTNGAVNGNWYATVVDLNLPEHRGTVLATSNFFDIIGKAIGPLIGSIFRDLFSAVVGMAISIIAWVFIIFFWVPVLRNFINEMDETERIFTTRLEKVAKK